MKLLLIILVLTVCCRAFCKTTFIAGAGYSSNMLYRGALIYDAPIAFPVFSFIYNDKLTLGANGLSLFKDIGTNQKISLGMNYFRDYPYNGVIKIDPEEKGFRNKRPPTYETNLVYNLTLFKRLATEIQYHKDLGRNFGNYYYGKAAYAIFPILHAGFGYGTGDLANNRYVYGRDARQGSGHRDFFLSFFWPLFGGTFQMNALRSEIIQRQNQKENFIRGDKDNYNLTFIMMWSF